MSEVKLYLGDCRDFMRTLPAGIVDVVIADIPYGVGIAYSSYDDTLDNWKSLMLEAIPEMRRVAKFVVVPSGQIKLMPWWYENIAPDWIIAWYKGSPGHNSQIGFNDWEPHLSWGKPQNQMHDYFHTKCGFDDNGHPCPKPVEWARWLVTRSTRPGATVLDPFMGSGTTGVACVQTGRNFIGCEIDEGYFKIAKRRIELAQQQPLLPFGADETQPKAEQLSLV